MTAYLVILAGLPLWACLLSLYKFAGLNWELPLLGLGLAVACALFLWVARRLAHGLAPAMVWGSLAGAGAAALFLALIAPLSGLTWMLVAPFHHDLVKLGFMLAGAIVFARGPLAGRWPRLPSKAARSGSWGLPLFLALCALLMALALALGLAALSPGGEAEGAGGIKALLKDPRPIHWALFAAGIGLAAIAAWRPVWLLEKGLPGAGFGLIWAGMAMDVVSAMDPVLSRFSPEALQGLLAAAGIWLGICLADRSESPRRKQQSAN